MALRATLLSAILVALGLAGLSFVHAAEDSAAAEPGSDRYSGQRWRADRVGLKIGGGRFESDVSARSDGDLGIGFVIDLEDHLGYDRWSDLFNAEVYYRFNQRRRIDVNFWKLDRSSTVQLDRELEINGEMVPVGAIVDSGYEFTIFDVEYKYAFLNLPRAEIGFTFGLGVLNAEWDFFAGAGAGGLGKDVEDVDDITIPFPMIGFYNELKLSRRVDLAYSARLMSLEYEQYEGNIAAFTFSFTFYAASYLGLEVG